MEQTYRLLRNVICYPIKLYQCLISPMLSCCRFHPSCSHYAIEAITHYGIWKGFYLTGYRLLRCHPWAEGGYDPVLPNEEKF